MSYQEDFPHEDKEVKGRGLATLSSWFGAAETSRGNEQVQG